MFYMPRISHFYHQPEYHLHGYHPRCLTSLYDDDHEHEHDDYVETKRREYREALHHQHHQCEYERAVALENQRHRAQLAALAEREALRKRGSRYRPRSSYVHKQPQISTLEEPARHPQPSQPQPQSRRPLDNWQARPLNVLYEILAEYIRQQTERVSIPRGGSQGAINSLVYQEPSGEEEILVYQENSGEEEIPELEDAQQRPQPTIHSETQSVRRATPPQPRGAPAPRQCNAQADSQTTQKPPLQSVRVPIVPLPPTTSDSDSEPDLSKRTHALTAIAEIAHTFDTLRRTFTFPPGPLERNPHSSTSRLAPNAQNSVVGAYENALYELLAKLDAVDSFGLKVVRDARKELVVQIERELDGLEKKITTALGTGETKEGLGEEEVEKPAHEDVRMEVHPAVAQVETPEAVKIPEAPSRKTSVWKATSPPIVESVLNAPENVASIPDPQTTD